MSDITLTRPAEGILVATLDRPDRLNSITAQMFDDFEQLAHDLNRGAVDGRDDRDPDVADRHQSIGGALLQ